MPQGLKIDVSVTDMDTFKATFEAAYILANAVAFYADNHDDGTTAKKALHYANKQLAAAGLGQFEAD